MRKISKDITDSPGKVEKIVLKVEKPSGEGIPQKAVSFSLISDSLKLLDGPKEVMTDSNGIAKYETWGLSAGKYFVVAELGNQKTTFSIKIQTFSLGILSVLWPWVLIIPVISVIVYFAVIWARSGNIVIDQKTGRGIQGVFIEIYDDLGRIVVNTVSGPGGRFRANLLRGEYLMKVSKGGYVLKEVAGHSESSDIQSSTRLFINKTSKLKILMQVAS